MYDRTTRSLWHSVTGVPVIGELANSGITLDRYPVTVTTWLDWLEQHPDTTVVDIETGYQRRYFDPAEQGSAYYEYRASPEAMFPTFGVDGRVPEKESVVGIAFEGESGAYPVDVVVAERVVNASVGDADVMLVGHPLIGVVGVFERRGKRFVTGDGPRVIMDELGVDWTATDDALVSAGGESLARIPARELFWFAWAAFYPGTGVYEGG